MNMRCLLTSTLFSILFFSVIHAQISSNAIDSLMQQAMNKFKVAGAAVAVVKDGKVLHAKGYGIRSIETKLPVDEHTNFAIASNTKAFTTTALALLVEDGKLQWTDKVKQHIPEFKMYNPYVTENFNIQDLLTHRSGLGLGVGDLMFFPDGGNFKIEDLLNSFQYFKPVSAFRTKYDYDNLLYIVAGELIKRVSGQTWEIFVAERILKPLGMDNSFTDVGKIPKNNNIAMPHSSDTGHLVPFEHFTRSINGAAGGIFANVDDLSQWMLVNLNKGKYGPNLEKQLFSEASQQELWKIHTVLPSNPSPRYNTHFKGYGLGWVLADVRGNMQVSHTGGLPGMLSKTVLIPDLNLGVVVLTNTSEDGAAIFQAVSQTILDSYFGLDSFDWINFMADQFKVMKNKGDAVTVKVWETVEKADAFKINEIDYIGVYEDKWFGKVEVYKDGDQLRMWCHRSPKLNGSMHFYKANTFAIRWNYRDMNCDAFASFQLDEEGKATRIKMKGISPNIDFSFDFHDLDLIRIE